MRRVVKKFTQLVLDTVAIQAPVYEFGAMEVHEEGAADATNFRQAVTDKGLPYVGCDMRDGEGVDKVLNLHDIDLPNESVGLVLCLDTLEHVEYPRKAMSEILRILKPNGLVVITSVMNFPIHAYPHDYWRFTPEAFKSLLKEFDHQEVTFCGNELFPRTIVGVGFKGEKPDLTAFYPAYELWRERENHRIKKVEEAEQNS